jgi:hypothetical protein
MFGLHDPAMRSILIDRRRRPQSFARGSIYKSGCRRFKGAVVGKLVGGLCGNLWATRRVVHQVVHSAVHQLIHDTLLPISQLAGQCRCLTAVDLRRRRPAMGLVRAFVVVELEVHP